MTRPSTRQLTMVPSWSMGGSVFLMIRNSKKRLWDRLISLSFQFILDWTRCIGIWKGTTIGWGWNLMLQSGWLSVPLVNWWRQNIRFPVVYFRTYPYQNGNGIDQKATSLWTLGCHKPVIPVVTFLTPLASNFEGLKDHLNLSMVPSLLFTTFFL